MMIVFVFKFYHIGTMSYNPSYEFDFVYNPKLLYIYKEKDSS